MTFRILALGAALVLSAAGSAAAQTVKLEFVDGRVNLVAQNAPMRVILTEWARLGKTQIVGAERLTGPPVTLEISGSPERYALDVLLRNVPGYLVTARQTSVQGASSFDRIMILPTTTAPRPTSTAATFGPPPPPLMPEAPAEAFDRDEEATARAEEARVRAEMEARMRAEQAARNAAAGRPAATTPGPNNGFVTIGVPQPLVPPTEPLPGPTVAPQPTPAQPQTPTNPFTTLPGSSRPGEVTPVPQQPTNRPGAPPDPDRF